ncbi:MULTISPECIES: phage tail tape measure protein [unclassified Campylobacter]|uniref:phage tail tape measure protein n=1 Tax=unclassified Campylobacter TaxID=2593542 RepID=UPI003D32F1F2
MSKQTLTFALELKGLDNILSRINKSQYTLSESLNKSLKVAHTAYKKALDDVKLNPTLQPHNFKSELDRLKKQIKVATTANLKLKMDEARNNIEKLKVDILAAFGAFKTLQAPINAAMSFESAMADVKKVVDFETPEELKEFSNEILKLTKTIPMSAKALTEITAGGGQMGIAKKDLLQYTQMAAKVAVAYGISAESAGENIGKISNILRLNLDQTASLMDSINHLSDNSASKASEIMDTLKQGLGGTAKMVGLTGEQASALASTFISLGKDASTASNAAGALLERLNAPNKQMLELFKHVGIDSKDFANGLKKDAQRAVIFFLEQIKKLDPQKQMELLTNAIGRNYNDDIATLVGSLDVYKKALKEVGDVQNYQNSVQKEFANRSNTAENKLQLLKSSFERLGITIGNIFLPIVSKAFEAVAGVINKVSNFVSEHKRLVEVLGYAIGAIFAYRTAILAAKIASSAFTLVTSGGCGWLLKFGISCQDVASKLSFMNLKNIIAQKTMALWGVVSAGYVKAMALIKSASFSMAGVFKILRLALISTGIGAIVVALGVAASYVVANWQKVKAFFSGFFDGLKKELEPINKIFSPLIETTKALFNTLFGGSAKTSEELKEATKAGERFGEVVGKALGFILTPLELVLKAITAVIEGIKEAIKWVDELSIDKAINGVKDTLGIGGGKERKWYNPFSWGNDKTQLQTTNGTIDKITKTQNQNTDKRTINDNKTVNIYMQNTAATPQEVARAVENRSYAFTD